MNVLLVIQLRSHNCQPDPTTPTPEEPGGDMPSKTRDSERPMLGRCCMLEDIMIHV